MGVDGFPVRDISLSAGSEARRSLLAVTGLFPPANVAGVHRLIRFVSRLEGWNWRISVLTVAPSDYDSSVDLDESLTEKIPRSVRTVVTPVLRPLPALSKLLQSLRSASAAASSQGRQAGSRPLVQEASARSPGRFSAFIIRSLSTPDIDVGWLPYAVPEGLDIISRDRPDVILSSGPPHTAHLVAAALKRFSRCCWVADFRDPWARNPWQAPAARGDLAQRIDARLEAAVVRSADSVVLNTPRMRDEFRRHYQATPAEKFLSIPNGFDADSFEPLRRVDRHDDGIVRLTHAGSLYEERDPFPLFRAIASLLKKGAISSDSFQFIQRGFLSDPSEVTQRISELELDSVVRILPNLPYAESLRELARSDIFLLIQPGTTVQVPAKLYEYIALGRPILALAPDGAVKDLIEEGRLGMVAPCRDDAAIETALQRLIEDRRAGRRFRPDREYISQFEGERLAGRMHAVLVSTCSKRR